MEYDKNSIQSCSVCNISYTKGWGSYCSRSCCAVDRHRKNPQIIDSVKNSLKVKQAAKIAGKTNITKYNKSDKGRETSRNTMKILSNNPDFVRKRNLAASNSDRTKSTEFLQNYNASEQGSIRSKNNINKMWNNFRKGLKVLNPYSNNFRKENNGYTPLELRFAKILDYYNIPYHYNAVFKPSRYRPDFYLYENKIIIELDDPQFHDCDHDKKRDDYFNSLGIKTVRIQNSDLEYYTDEEVYNIYLRSSNV